jgi:hypothetical protein
LYARIRTRPTDLPELAALAETSRKIVTVVLFKSIQTGVEQIALGNDNHIESRRNLVSTKDLSNESFSPIPLNRPTQLARSGDTQPADRQRIGPREEGAVTAMNPTAVLIDLQELGAAANALVCLETHSAALEAGFSALA